MSRDEAWSAASSTPGEAAIRPSRPSSPTAIIMAQPLGIGGADRGEQPERDRQVEMRPLLGQVGGRQIDRDPLGRKRQPDRRQRRAHALTALGDRLVGKADDDEGGKPGAQLHLHFNAARLEPQICNGGDGRDHYRPRPCLPQHWLRKYPPGSAERG